MARWKLGPQGAYFDANDSGPNQVDPPPMAQQPGGAPQMPTQAGGIDMGGTRPWSEQMPDGNGGYYNPGGHVDASGNPMAQTQMQRQNGQGEWLSPTAWANQGGAPKQNGTVDDGQAYLDWTKGAHPMFGTPEYVNQFNARFGGGDAPEFAQSTSGAFDSLTGQQPPRGMMSPVGAAAGAFGSLLKNPFGGMFGVRR